MLAWHLTLVCDVYWMEPRQLVVYSCRAAPSWSWSTRSRTTQPTSRYCHCAAYIMCMLCLLNPTTTTALRSQPRNIIAVKSGWESRLRCTSGVEALLLPWLYLCCLLSVCRSFPLVTLLCGPECLR